jgi:hypothetical protein|tara:strand:+ start:2304 stop:3221 length:918 start_codon:yes stop_codon:yes gene_type:complete
MIKLKDLLNETMYGSNLNDKWYPAHTRDSLTWTLTQNYVPLYPKTMEQIIGKIPINAFHVTDPNHIKTLKDILGKKKSISTFTKANKSSQLAKGRGVQTGSGGVIFHVEGLLLARQYMDFDTVPDKMGRRWVMGRYIFDNDPMIVRSAMQRAKMPDSSEWRDIEQEIADEVENDPANEGLRYTEVMAKIKKKLGPVVNKHIKKYIDITNGLLKKHKKDVIKSITQPSEKTSAWWNEIVIYNVKVKDVFVLKRVWEDYYFQNDNYDDQSYKKDLLSYVDESKITIGTPAQFRKWYTTREGEITIDG